MDTKSNHPAPAGETFTVVRDDLDLPPGARFNVAPGPVKADQPAMIEIGERQTIGRHYSDVAGLDWITQPDLIIRVTGKVPVRVVGPVIPSEALQKPNSRGGLLL